MANELKYRVDVSAGVTGKGQVDGLTNSVDALGKGAKQAGESSRTASAGLAEIGAAAQQSSQAFAAVNAAVVKYDALLRPIIQKTDDSAQAFAAVAAAGARARRSVDEINASFSALGIRSAAKIKADIQAVNQSLIQLARSGRASGAEFDRAFAAGQAQIARFRAELEGVGPAAEGTRKHADGLLSVFGRLGLAFSGAQLAREFLTVNVELERMERTFQAVTGSSELAAAEMVYAREVADRLALPVLAAGKAYADLMAATKGTAVEGQATRSVFEAVARSMSVAGKSADDTQGALLALSQMASKGVVSMEELRGQLGERLPGAINAVANGFGITTAQLIKLTESGQLTAEQLFPALARGLETLYGATSQSGQAVDTLGQKWDRFKNALADAFKTLGDAGVVDLLKNSLQLLEAAVVSTSGALVVSGQKIGIFFAALKQGEIGLNGFSERAKEAFAEVDLAAQEKLVSAARHNSVLAAALEKSGSAGAAAAKGLAELGQVTTSAASASGAAADGLVRVNVLYGELAEAGKAATKAAADSADARKAEGAAAVALASALGTEGEQRVAAAQAAQGNATALGKLAAERQADLALAERHLARIQAEIAVRGQATAAEQSQIDGLVKLVEARRNEADAATATAQAAAVSAAASETAVLAVADNSARVKELAEAYLAAAAARAGLDADKLAGLEVGAQLAEAQIVEAQAAALYRDALKDQTAAIEQNASVKQAQLNLDQVGIKLAIEQQRTLLEVARARGDERGAIAALLEMKRLEIKLAELLARAKKAEADAALAAVQARRAELEAAGQLTAAKEAELQALEAGARVKQVEAEIAAEGAKRLRELADAAQEAGEAAGTMGAGFRQSSADLDRLGDSASRASGKVRELKDVADRPSPRFEGTISGEVDRRGRGFSGDINVRDSSKERTVQELKDANFTESEIQNYYSDRRTTESDKAAGNVSRSVNTQQINADFLARSKGLSGPAVKAFVDAFGENFAAEMAGMAQRYAFRGPLSAEEYVKAYSGSLERAVDTTVQQAKSTVGKARRAEADASGDPASTHRVEITLNGKKSTVDTASPNAAQALISMLTDLSKRAA